jgi:hypothetical protein
MSLVQWFKHSAPPAPAGPADGDAETLKSGRWALHQAIPQEAFPSTLLLRSADTVLAETAPGECVLTRTQMGSQTVELLLRAGEAGVDLCIRVPTAANQYKEPYILMEAEDGNTREDAVREVQFHLQGRVADEEVARADWADIFRKAAMKLEALR